MTGVPWGLQGPGEDGPGLRGLAGVTQTGLVALPVIGGDAEHSHVLDQFPGRPLWAEAGAVMAQPPFLCPAGPWPGRVPGQAGPRSSGPLGPAVASVRPLVVGVALPAGAGPSGPVVGVLVSPSLACCCPASPWGTQWLQAQAPFWDSLLPFTEAAAAS